MTNRKAKPPSNFKPSEAALRSAFPVTKSGETVTVQEQSITVNVALPPPQMLRDYEDARPGTMDLLIRWNEEEQAHRRAMERLTVEANISTQSQQVALAQMHATTQRDIAIHQALTVRRSDLAGQIFGFLICVLAIVGAVILATSGHEAAAAVLAAIPTAAIIQSFRTLAGNGSKPPAKK